MAKVLEGPGMGLMKKWGITVPNYVVVTSVDELTKLGQANEWLKKSKLVVKAHEALGSRFKLGLVKVGSGSQRSGSGDQGDDRSPSGQHHRLASDRV